MFDRDAVWQARAEPAAHDGKERELARGSQRDYNGAMSSAIEQFLDGATFAVVGASANRHKYGNKVLRCYQQDGRTAHPVHPTATEVEGAQAYASLKDLPESVHGVSIITPPEVTEAVVEEALALGIEHLWMQTGAESDAAIAAAEAGGISVIAGGPCLLVVLGFRE